MTNKTKKSPLDKKWERLGKNVDLDLPLALELLPRMEDHPTFQKQMLEVLVKHGRAQEVVDVMEPVNHNVDAAPVLAEFMVVPFIKDVAFFAKKHNPTSIFFTTLSETLADRVGRRPTLLKAYIEHMIAQGLRAGSIPLCEAGLALKHQCFPKQELSEQLGLRIDHYGLETLSNEGVKSYAATINEWALFNPEIMELLDTIATKLKLDTKLLPALVAKRSKEGLLKEVSLRKPKSPKVM